jgi:hypothetical protein
MRSRHETSPALWQATRGSIERIGPSAEPSALTVAPFGSAVNPAQVQR